MFCPKCGSADQQENAYCRNCGMFLPDFDKAKNQQTTPEQHLKANLVLNFMTAIASLALAIMLYVFVVGKGDTSPLIYLTAGFLTAMFAWQVQIIIRTFMLKKHFRTNRPTDQSQKATPVFENLKTRELLNDADFSNHVAASVTENTTNKLKEKVVK
jgi:flagellar basal body-associated protein FliL